MSTTTRDRTVLGGAVAGPVSLTLTANPTLADQTPNNNQPATPIFGIGVVGLLVLALCPFSMFLMMRGMQNHNNRDNHRE